MRWAIVVADRIGGNYVFSSHEFVILMLAMFQNVIPHEVSASACSSGVLAIGMFKISKWIIKPDVNLIISNNHISIYIYISSTCSSSHLEKPSTVSLSSAACGKLRHWGSLALLSPWRCDWGALGQLECCGFNPSPKKLGKFVEIYGNCEFWCRWPAISLDPGHRDVKCS